MNKKEIEKQIEKLEKKHDKIENPICYTRNCPVCNKITELLEELKRLKEKKK